MKGLELKLDTREPEIEDEAEKTWKALVVSVDAFRDFSDHS